MKLKVSQKNELFDYISQSKLGPGLFRYDEVDDWHSGESYAIIQSTSHDYSFKISEDNGRISILVSPGHEKMVEVYRVDRWEQVAYFFIQWVNDLEEEILVGDKWQEFDKLIRESSLIVSTNIINDKFSVTEYFEIQNKIGLMRTELLKIDLAPEQLKLINDKLDIVLEQTKSMGKFDWRSFFVGTIMSIILQLSLSQEQGKEIWEIIKHVFSSYLIGFN